MTDPHHEDDYDYVKQQKLELNSRLSWCALILATVATVIGLFVREFGL